MPHFVGLDVSLGETSIVVLDEAGHRVAEGVAATDPKAIKRFLRGDRRRYSAIGLEASSTAIWLTAALQRAGLPAVCIDAGHAHQMLKAARNKTDKNDARGLAAIMRAGTYRPVHLKSQTSQRVKVTLAARRILLAKAMDLQIAVRGFLRSFGLSVGYVKKRDFSAKVRATAKSVPGLIDLVLPLLEARDALLSRHDALDAVVVAAANADPNCRLLMTAPGVGPIVALSFCAAIDDPARFSRSRDVGAYFGLTRRSNQSGQSDLNGGISKRGDRTVRSLLFQSAHRIMQPRAKDNALKRWGLNVAARRGAIKAIVAVARRLAVILHRMLQSGTEYREASPSMP